MIMIRLAVKGGGCEGLRDSHAQIKVRVKARVRDLPSACMCTMGPKPPLEDIIGTDLRE